MTKRRPSCAADLAGGTRTLRGRPRGARRDRVRRLVQGLARRPGAATGWTTAQAPIAPGQELTLRFMILDADDPMVRLDNFKWLVTRPLTT